MLLGVSCLSGMDSVVKALLLRDISVVEIIAVRGWIIMSVLTASLPLHGGWQALATQRWRLHLLRNAIGIFAPVCFFLSLKYLPIAEATAIFFCTTFFMTAGSVFVLGEKVGMHRWSAVAIGFAGVLIVSSPGTAAFHPAALLALAAGASYAGIVLFGRLLTRTDTPFKLVYYFTGFNTLATTLVLPFFWTTPDLEAIGLLFVVSALALSGYFCMTYAFSTAPVGALAPIEYVAMIWASVLGYLFWAEVPSTASWIGMGLILAAGLYIMWRESRVGEPHTPAPEPLT